MQNKRFVTGVILLMAILVMVGCSKSAQERINIYENALEQYQVFSTDTDLVVEQTKIALAAAKDALIVAEDPVLISKITRDIISLEAKITDAMEYKVKADEMVALYKQKIADIKVDGSVDFGEELTLIGEGIKSISTILPPPFNVYGALAGLIVTGVAGYAGGKKRENVTNTRPAKIANADLVNSVDDLLVSSAVINVDAAKDILRDSQADETRKLVSSIKSPYENAV